MDLIASVDGSPSAVLTRQWKLLRITLGVGYAQDTAALTLTAAGIVLPRDAVSIQFAVDGVDLGSFNVTRMRGDTRAGSVTILATALDPTSTLHQPRNRAWAGQSIEAMVDAIASEAGLETSVAPDIGRRILAARLQRSESDLAFLQRTIANLEGRVLIQEGRLVVTMGDTPVVPPPPLSIDLQTTGAWVAWERQWSEPLTRVEATYIGDDGSSLEVVEVGSGTQVRRLPTTYASRADAEAAATSWLSRDRATRDYVEVTTAFTPSAQILQPLAFTGATERIPGEWPPRSSSTASNTPSAQPQRPPPPS